LKLFDIIGVLVVVCWVGVVGWVGYRELNGDEKAVSLDDIRLTEGDAWMVLNRENEEVGFVHETRTRIDDGWLLEYELAFQIDIASQKKLLESRTRATLDDKAYLRQFNADISSFIGSFIVRGEVSGNTITLTSNIGGGEQKRTVTLPEPPRLANNAVNQLIANPEALVPGQNISQEYFDPMSSGMSKLTYTYIEKTTVSLYAGDEEAYHFRQQLMGDEMDVYISPEGEILIQEFPMQTIGSKIPASLGKTRSSALRRKFKEEAAKAKKDGKDKGAIEKILDQQEIKPDEQGLQNTLSKLGQALMPGARRPPSARAPDMGADDNADMSADMNAPTTDKSEPEGAHGGAVERASDLLHKATRQEKQDEQ
jgi:hypothetical protein